MRTLSIFSTLVALCIAATALPRHGEAQSGSRYPLVFESGKEMKRLGLALHGYGKDGPNASRLPNRCYYYGDGYNDISISNEFLAKYRARGFSLNSLCLALQSPLAFDPETGERLPSYMVADIAEVRKYGEASGAGVMSNVLPLRVPDCFARGLPYHDCRFAYDIVTGRRLTRAELAKIEKARGIFDRDVAKAKRNRAYSAECPNETDQQFTFNTTARCRQEKDAEGTLHPEGNNLFTYFGESGITLIDASPSLPLGFGYQLYTDGTAGPGGGDEKTALDSSRRATNAKVLAAMGDM